MDAESPPGDGSMDETVHADHHDAASLDATLAETGTPKTRTAAPSPAPLTRGATVGRYLLLHQLGEGGMGTVFAAHDPELDRKVAIKVIRTSAHGPDTTRGRQRLLREAQAMAKLSHPNVATVHDVGEHDGQVYVAMEFIDGVPLGEWLSRSPRHRDEILDAFDAAAQGLAAAHASKIVHRDFKPDNVMMGEDGRVRVLDFGLATWADRPPRHPADEDGAQAPPPSKLDSVDQQLTQAGAVMGTPRYMSPEQFSGKESGPASDQFSFCVALWEAFAKERPFAGDSWSSLGYAVTRGKLRDPPAGTMPRWLQKILVRGLAVEPERRWPDMQALRAQISRGRKRPRKIWTGVGLGLIATAAGGVWLGARNAHTAKLQACQDEADAMVDFWTEARRTELERHLGDAIFGSDPRRTGRALDRIDEHVESLRSTAESTCTWATVSERWSAETRDRARSCLRVRRHEMDAAIRRLESSEDWMDATALGVVSELTPASSCASEAYLQIMPPPPSPEQLEQLDALDERFTEVAQRIAADDVDGAASTLEAIVERAREIGWTPRIASARVEHAEVLYAAGHFEPAFEQARLGFFGAAAVQDWPTAMNAAGGMLRASASKRDDQATLRWEIDLGELALAQVGDGPDVGVVHLSLAMAGAHRRLAQYDRALQNVERAERVAKALFGEDSSLYAEAISRRGMYAYDRRDYTEAVKWFEQSAAHYPAGDDEDDPGRLRMLSRLGVAKGLAGDPEGSLALHLEVVEAYRRHLRPDHPTLLSEMHNLSNAYRSVAQFEEAAAIQRDRLSALEKTHEPTDRELRGPLNQLAFIYADAGNAAAATQAATRLLESSRVSGDAADVAHGQAALSRARRLAGETDEALDLARQAWAAMEKAEVHIDVANMSRLALAEAELAAGHGDTALELAEATLKDMSSIDYDDFVLARIRLCVAEALRAQTSPSAEDLARADDLTAQVRSVYARYPKAYAHVLDKL